MATPRKPAKTKTTPKATGESFMQPEAAPSGDLTRPGKFDINAWAADEVVISQTTKVTRRPDLAQRVVELQEERAQLELVMAQVDGTTQTRRRMAQKDDRAQRIRQIDAELEQLHADLEGTWIEVYVRAMEPLEQDKLRAEKHAPGTPLAAACYAVTGKVRQLGSQDDDDWTELDQDEWLTLFAKVGIRQFEMLDRLFGSLTYGIAVTPDFYERLSRHLTTRTSSES